MNKIARKWEIIMIKLEIVGRDDCLFKLKDDTDKLYTICLKFLDIKEDFKIGDYISISAELLNPRYAGYSTNYSFGSLESKYGKDKIELYDIDVIKIETEDKEIYLKRLYG